jgi:hypothetical protein
MRPDSTRLMAIDAGVIVVISLLICAAADRLVFMSIAVPMIIAVRMFLLYALRRNEGIHFRVELVFFGICTLLGAYNDYFSVCIKNIYDYTVPHFFSWSTIPLWMLLYWGMILRTFARFARWEVLKPPEVSSDNIGFGRWYTESVTIKIVFMLALVFVTRNQIYQHYLHPIWSWVPFLAALLIYLTLCAPTLHDIKLMVVVLPVGPLVEMLYINLGGLHRYHLGVAGGVPLWIILWWLLIILIWKDIAMRLEIRLRRVFT